MVVRTAMLLVLTCVFFAVMPVAANSPAGKRYVLFKKSNPHYYQAEKYREEKKFDKAKAEYSILIESTPGNIGYRISRGQIELQLKDYNAAIADAEKIMALSDAPYMRFLASEIRAKAYAGLDRSSEAIEEYKLALKINPTEPDAQLHLGKLLFQAKRYDEAIAPLQIARSQFQQMRRIKAPGSANEANLLIEKIEKMQAKARQRNKSPSTKVD